MKYTSYEEKRNLAKKCSSIIDSSWHYSWHWPRTDSGDLTDNGWEKVLEDARGLALHYKQRAESIKELIPQIEKVVWENKGIATPPAERGEEE